MKPLGSLFFLCFDNILLLKNFSLSQKDSTTQQAHSKDRAAIKAQFIENNSTNKPKQLLTAKLLTCFPFLTYYKSQQSGCHVGFLPFSTLMWHPYIVQYLVAEFVNFPQLLEAWAVPQTAKIPFTWSLMCS